MMPSRCRPLAFIHCPSRFVRSTHGSSLSLSVFVSFWLDSLRSFEMRAPAQSVCVCMYTYMYMRVQHPLHQSVSDRLHRVGRRMTAAPAARRWCVSCPLSCFSLLPHTHIHTYTHTYPHTHTEREREREMYAHANVPLYISPAIWPTHSSTRGSLRSDSLSKSSGRPMKTPSTHDLESSKS